MINNNLKTLIIPSQCQFTLQWVDGTEEVIYGTDIIDAFKRADIPLTRFEDLTSWDITTKADAIANMCDSVNQAFEAGDTFTVCLDQMDELDFWIMNGKLPYDVALQIERGEEVEYTPPTVDEELTRWGFDVDLHKVLVIEAMDVPPYAHKLLKHTLTMQIPVVYNVMDKTQLPKEVQKRLFDFSPQEEE